MLSEKKDHLIIKNSEITFEKVIKNSFLSEVRSNELNKSKVLLIPLKDFREKVHLSFYKGARELYLYVNENNPELNFDLCIEKSDYQEITLNSDEFRLGTFLLQFIFAPLFVNIISKYIITGLSAKKEDKINIDLIITDQPSNDQSLYISYRGNPVDFKQRINEKLKLYSESGKIIEEISSGNKIDALF